MILKLLFNLLKVLNSNKNPGEIAAGFSFGIMLSLIPGGNLLWITLFIIGFFTRVNLMTAFLTLGVGKLFVPLIDPLLDNIGYFILNIPALRSFFTFLFNLPVVPLTSYNNTIVMGGFMTSLVLAFPLYLTFRSFITAYRVHIRDKIRNTKFARHLLKLPVVGKLGLLAGKYRTFTGRG